MRHLSRDRLKGLAGIEVCLFRQAESVSRVYITKRKFLSTNMFNFDFITVGGGTEDITFCTDEGVLVGDGKDVTRQKLFAFEYGAKLKTDRAYSTFGGGAANAAVSLSRLGFRVASVIPVGGDIRGEKIRNNLKKHKVNTGMITKRADRESPFSFLIMGKDGEHVAFVYSGAKKNFKIPEKNIERIKRTKWVYITSMAAGWRNNMDSLISHKDLKLAWNPGNTQIKAGLPRLKKYLRHTDVLGVNKDEAIELALSAPQCKRRSRSYLNNIRNLLKVLKAYGPSIVVVTDGERGSQAFDGNSFYYQKVRKVKKAADTTGVGDAFHSGFVAGMEFYNGDIQRSMELGMWNSASVVQQRGAQNGLLSKGDIQV